MKPLKWLYPGLKVKRWFLMFLGGVIIGSYGLLMLIPALVPLFSLGKGLGLIVLGCVVAVIGFRQFMHSLVSVFLPAEGDRLVDVVWRQRQLGKGPKIVAIGGGTGLSVLLRGLKDYSSNITAIVTVTDNGGSSGRLRQELGILPPGDIRNCLVALADTEPLMEQLFQHRFHEGESLAGHNLGNLFLAGLTEILGDFAGAVRQASRVLAVRGQVLPSTLENVTLQAELYNGEIVDGEINIGASQGKSIKRLFVNPPDPKPLPEAIQALEEADAIILGPGSLFTSILPNLLVKELVAAMGRSSGIRIYVCNVMTQPGETDGFTAADHLATIHKYIGPGLIDYIVVNTERVKKQLLQRYEEEGAFPVQVNKEQLRKLGVKTIFAQLISPGECGAP
ncbi:MAG: gluconeogenesis factor YvcK family protein [bacterium]